MRDHRHQSGFNLLELLIGLAIGLVGLLAVSQIMFSFNQQRTTVTQTMSTQNNGVMALYLMERDLSQAGYAMGNLNCDRINYYLNGTAYYNSPYGTTTLPGAGNVALTTLPVRIIDGGNSSDIIEVQYGSSSSGIPGTEVIAPQTAGYGSNYSVAAATGFSIGDRIVANVAGWCTLASVTAVTSPDPGNATSVTYPVTTAVSHTATGTVGYNVGSFSPPTGNGWNVVTDVSTSPKPYLSNLGAFVSRRYAVGSNALTLAELETLNTTVTPPANLVDDIIFLKAQYGLSNSTSSTVVSSWVPGSDLATSAYDSSFAQRIVAVRIGVVARSPLLEKTAVPAPATLSVLPAIMPGTTALTAPASGQCALDNTTKEVQCTVPDTHYRYRTYSTIIPLRNVIWTR